MAVLFANDTVGPSSEYADQLRKEHNGSKWGSTGAKYSGRDVLRILSERPYIKTVLDFGAGKASLGEYIQEYITHAITWTNYDPGIPAYDVLAGGQYDCVVSTDMLEHVEPERLEDTLRIMAGKARKVLISDIACYPTGKLFGAGPYKDQDLHLTIMTPDEWRELFDTHVKLHLAEYHAMRKFSKGKYKDRCLMVHERV